MTCTPYASADDLGVSVLPGGVASLGAAPGGGAAPWLRNLIVGGVTLPFVPAALTE